MLKQETKVSNTQTNTTTSGESASSVDWDSLDMQRDIAFKIVYFFIVFIIGTFGLLYAYF